MSERSFALAVIEYRRQASRTGEANEATGRFAEATETRRRAILCRNPEPRTWTTILGIVILGVAI